jgi:hypothetical protein
MWAGEGEGGGRQQAGKGARVSIYMYFTQYCSLCSPVPCPPPLPPLSSPLPATSGPLRRSSSSMTASLTPASRAQVVMIPAHSSNWGGSKGGSTQHSTARSTAQHSTWHSSLQRCAGATTVHSAAASRRVPQGCAATDLWTDNQRCAAQAVAAPPSCQHPAPHCTARLPAPSTPTFLHRMRARDLLASSHCALPGRRGGGEEGWGGVG